MFLSISYYLVRAFLAIVFVTAGAAKITDGTNFGTTLVSLGIPMHSQKSARGIAITISLTEILVGIFVISELWPIIINAVLFGAMGSFTLVVLYALHKAPHATCHCFGALSNSQFSKRGLLRNLLLTAAALMVLLLANDLPQPQFHELFPIRLLLIAGYLLLALCTVQATRVIALVKERASL